VPAAASNQPLDRPSAGRDFALIGGSDFLQECLAVVLERLRVTLLVPFT